MSHTITVRWRGLIISISMLDTIDGWLFPVAHYVMSGGPVGVGHEVEMEKLFMRELRKEVSS